MDVVIVQSKEHERQRENAGSQVYPIACNLSSELKQRMDLGRTTPRMAKEGNVKDNWGHEESDPG